ncbi:hypothetical protein WAF17_00030 [Bernardetia sp. ABR2-2B]|uniref:hypothetical protein n=1 Tax=Bernardetia sp. ABR2-2B TaxID=3127472 RepID=UPI0030D55037
MNKDIFFNFLVLVLGTLFFAFQFSVEYFIYEGLQEVLQKAEDIQPSLHTSQIGKRTIFGILLIVLSYFTIRKSTAFKLLGKVGIFFLFLGILIPFFFLAFFLFKL